MKQKVGLISMLIMTLLIGSQVINGKSKSLTEKNIAAANSRNVIYIDECYYAFWSEVVDQIYFRCHDAAGCIPTPHPPMMGSAVYDCWWLS